MFAKKKDSEIELVPEGKRLETYRRHLEEIDLLRKEGEDRLWDLKVEIRHHKKEIKRLKSEIARTKRNKDLDDGTKEKEISLRLEAIKAQESAIKELQEAIAKAKEIKKTNAPSIKEKRKALKEFLRYNLLPKEELKEQIELHEVAVEDLANEGETRITLLQNEIRAINGNKQIEKDTKKEIVLRDKERLHEARDVRHDRSHALKVERKKLLALLRPQYALRVKERKEEAKKAVGEALEQKKAALYKEELRHKEVMEALKAKKATLRPEDKEAYEQELISEKRANLLAKEEAKGAYRVIKDQHKDAVHRIHLDQIGLTKKGMGDKLPFLEWASSKWENYAYRFTIRDFIFNNGLYLIIILFFVVVAIYCQLKEGIPLFTTNSIITMLNQASPRLFFSLGVAGLIVLAGTDLSIGRLIGLGGVLTVMLCTTNGIPAQVVFFGKPLDFSAIPLGVRVPLGFLLSILFCSAFSAMAGFFTAKFKMHPFISTLANQLIVFGGGVLVLSNGFTGTSDPGVSDAIIGDIMIGGFALPRMIIYAVIITIVMWFIWNKTKFGKNMFAVGGNPEAAAVSGISVFGTTIGVFVMAGILYGIGASLFGIYSGSVRMQSGQGMESDAIAACVVGGVSFSGGVGTIRGVVIGTLLFQMIAVTLPYIGVGDTNAQLFIKGLVILIAVTFDCVKFLKKK